MAHLQYMPGDPRLVDQLVYELKSKGIFDQFRKDCIADVDTKPAYQNLRQRVESSVSTFLSRQSWQPDLNKNQLREKLRKHILDGNYLEQGVERIVDQVVNPKVASVFIPQVEDLVYNYLGITRKKSVTTAEISNEKVENLLPTDLEAVSPGSVKSNEGGDDKMDIDSSVAEETKMEFDEQEVEVKEESTGAVIVNQGKDEQVSELSNNKEINLDANKDDIPLPSEDIKIENIPPPENSPPQIDVTKIKLPKVSPDIPLPDSIIISSNIPLPDEIPKDMKDEYFKTINSDEDESSSDSSLRRNMSPLTPIRNFNNENSCDAQQAFENDLGNSKDKEQKEPSTFRFAIETKASEKEESIKIEKKEIEQINLSYQFNHQVNINNFNTPLYEDSSNSNNLQIDYESDANSKANLEVKANEEQSLDGSKKDRKVEDKKPSSKSSHRSRDSSKYSSSKDKRSDSKPSSSRDSSRHDKKTSREDSKSKSSHKDRSSDKSEKKDSDKKDRDSSKYRSSHKSSSHKDSKSHKSSSSSSSQRRSSSSKHSDEKKSSSSSNHKDKSEKSSERSSDKSSRDRSSKESKSSSHRSDKDRKSSSSKSSSKHDDKDKDKKSKKESDDHYSLSGRGNATRRSTDRDSNDGSSSSKGSHNPSSSKSSSSQKDSKGNSSKSDNTSPSGESTCPSDKENVLKETKKCNTDVVQPKPIVRIDTRLELPMASPPRLPFVPDVTLRKPKIAANLEEAKKLMKMRRFLDEEQKRMNQEAALLLEFQANVRPSLSQVYSSIPGPELEFACVINNEQTPVLQNNPCVSDSLQQNESILISNPTNALLAVVNAQNIEDITDIDPEITNLTESNDSMGLNNETINETELPQELDASKEETKCESEQSNLQTHEDSVEILDVAETRIPDVGNDIDETKEIVAEDDTITIADKEKCADDSQSAIELDLELEKEKSETEGNDTRTEYFEITVIAEELSENEETQNTVMRNFENDNRANEIVKDEEELPLDNNNTVIMKLKQNEDSQCLPDEQELKYFTESEKNEADLEKARFDVFLKAYTEKQSNNKVYLINCDSYEESVIKGVLETLGSFDIVNYQRNGHLKLPKTTKTIVKNVNVASEVSLPFDNNEFEAAANELEMDLKVTRPTVLSPVKSECSFELSNDYDAKIDEMVNNASRQEIMEIILGKAMSSESPSKMPRIDYVSESNIDSAEVNSLKRKLTEVETTVNNNRPVLKPRKLRKTSASDQITSTTEESEPRPSNNIQTNTRSKYLGRARRVGLPKPRKTDQPNSPSSDKSVENYEQNTKAPIPPTPNGKMKPQRSKIQRYDTSDLYKPKLHYLSRRNNIN